MTTQTETQRPIADLLEDARRDKGLSQRRAADALGTTPTTYRQWMRGQVPGLDRLDDFIEFTGLTKLDIVMAIVAADDAAKADAELRHAPVAQFKLVRRAQAA